MFFLESGDKISADMRVVECVNFTVDEALLTGESINVEKTTEKLQDNASLAERTNMVFSGSSVITGRATCVVVETGFNTEIGAIANKLNVVQDEKSPLNIRIAKFSKQISFAIVAISLLSVKKSKQKQEEALKASKNVTKQIEITDKKFDAKLLY